MASRIITLLSFFIASFSVSAQQLVCGTQPPTLQQQEIIKRSLASARFAEPLAPGAVNNFAIIAHIVRTDAGTGGLSETELNDAIDNVNTFYANANMSFFLLDVRYIDSSKYFDYFTGDEGEMTAANNYEGVINVYFVNSATNDEENRIPNLCGYAYFPGGPDVMVMVNSCTTNGSTFPHEIGHFFTLYHTHGTTNTGTTDELVIRPGEQSANCVENCQPANCDVAGDELCDTVADPNLSGQVDGSCAYVPNPDVNRPTEDANGDTFAPDATNIMSYSTKACRDYFSSGQYNRMDLAANSSRSYLFTGTLLAEFSTLSREICVGETVDFSDRSINATSYSWTFEGGSPATSTDPNPSVVYNTPGTYAVTLEISNGSGNTHTKAEQTLITVRPEITSNVTSTAGSFENAQIDESIIDYDGETFFVSNADSDGAQSAGLILNFGSRGSEDYLILEPMNTSIIKGYQLTFDYSYVAVVDQNEDKLEVVYRDPCGDWISLWSKQGVEMQTAPNNNQVIFFPTLPEHWRSESLIFEVDPAYDISEIAFRVTTDRGNTLQLDNYQLVPYATFDVTDVQIINPACADASDGSFTISTSSQDVMEYSLDGTTFSTSNEFTGLAPGTYTVIIRDAAGYQISHEVVLSPANEYPQEPVITFDASQLSIGSATAETVEWYLNNELIENSGVTIIDSAGLGIYTVVLSNGSCSTTSQSFEVFDIAVTDVINASCSDISDGSFSVTSMGQDEIEVSLGDGSFGAETTFSGLASGEYFFTVRGSSGYEITRSVTIDAENEYPETPTIEFVDGNLSVSTSGSETIEWYLNGDLINDTGASQIQAPGPGAYTVAVSNGACAVFSEPFVILSSALVENSMHLYPNPSSDYVEILVSDKVNTRELAISISDITGKVIYRGPFMKKMQISDLREGLYLLNVLVDGQMISRRFMKK